MDSSYWVGIDPAIQTGSDFPNCVNGNCQTAGVMWGTFGVGPTVPYVYHPELQVTLTASAANRAKIYFNDVNPHDLWEIKSDSGQVTWMYCQKSCRYV